MVRVKYTLVFPPESSTKPITYSLIRNFNIEVNILKGEITAGQEGRLLVELKGQETDIMHGVEFLKNENIKVVSLAKQICIEEDKCVHCGACTAVCFTKSLAMERNTWTLKFEPEKCVVCGLCVPACPLGIINISFGQEKGYE